MAPDGSYLSQVDIPGRMNGPQIVSIEGTFRVEGGFLIDTPTRYSETNISVPPTSRVRIIRIDDRELVVDYEKNPGTYSPTNPPVFRKQTK